MAAHADISIHDTAKLRARAEHYKGETAWVKFGERENLVFSSFLTIFIDGVGPEAVAKAQHLAEVFNLVMDGKRLAVVEEPDNALAAE